MCRVPEHKQIKKNTNSGDSVPLSILVSVPSRQKQHGRVETTNLPSASQYVLLHAFFGELLGFHVPGVLFKPFVLQALCTGQSGSAA